MTFALVILAAQAAATPLPAEEADAPAQHAEACYPVQAVVPPFNNTPEAMDQARMAAGYVLAEERGRARRAGKAPDDTPLCGGDRLAQLANGVNPPEQAPVEEPEAEVTEEQASSET